MSTRSKKTNQHQIFRNVSNVLRAVGLKATMDGNILTVSPYDKSRIFDLSNPDERQQWRRFFFIMKGRAERKRAAKARKRQPMSDLELFRQAGLI